MGQTYFKTGRAKSLGKFAVLFAVMAILPGMQSGRDNFESRILSVHNHERQAMGMPGLKWDHVLAQRAQRWADHLAAADKFEHSPNVPGEPLEGENIWGGTSGHYQPEDMVNLWIAEKANFRSGIFPRNSSTGRVQDVSHYTQLIWRKTDKVGCAISRGQTEEIMVCRYSEPGNRIGMHPLLG